MNTMDDIFEGLAMAVFEIVAEIVGDIFEVAINEIRYSLFKVL